MYEILIVAFLIVAIAIVVLVLIQKGKGADMGASFGAGASATLFGSAGTGNFLTRSTTILGIIFFILSIILANLSTKQHSNSTFSNIGSGTTTPMVPVTTDTSSATESSDNVVQPQSVTPTSEIPE